MDEIPPNYVLIYSTRNKTNHFVNKDFFNRILKEVKKEKKQNSYSEYGCRKFNNNRINIVGWNSVSIGTDYNKFLLNKYLHEKKVVFVLLNEVGNVNDKTIKLHENYDIIPNRELTAIIYNR